MKKKRIPHSEGFVGGRHVSVPASFFERSFLPSGLKAGSNKSVL